MEASFAGSLYYALFIAVSMALIVWPMKKRNPVALRAVISIVLIVLFVVIMWIFSRLWRYSTPSDIVGSYLVAYFIVYMCAEVTPMTACYFAVWGIMCIQFCTELGFVVLQIASLWGIVFQYEDIVYFGSALLFFMIMGIVEWKRMPRKSYHIGPRQFTLGILMLVLFECLYWITFTYLRQWADYRKWLFLFGMQIYCATVLYLQNELFKNSAMREEIQTLNWIQAHQKEQYELSKENIALINRKCHDLKHQINALRTMQSNDERERYVDEISNSIEIYDAMIHTGNEVVDTILTEKSLYCRANHIQIHCVVDGKQLQIMDSLDLYTIFGNAIDNAIEQVQNLEIQEKRVIDVIVHTQFQFLVIHIENPMDKEIEFQDGLPVSTKNKNGYHGFGLKSIRHTISKYHGQLSIGTEHGCFSLKMMVPIP